MSALPFTENYSIYWNLQSITQLYTSLKDDRLVLSNQKSYFDGRGFNIEPIYEIYFDKVLYPLLNFYLWIYGKKEY